MIHSMINESFLNELLTKIDKAMETNDRVFLSQQLICMLPPLALKILGYLLNWQKYDSIKYYPNQMCGFMHITEEELELGIQTLVDNKLIEIGKIDQTFMISINKETVRKYFKVDMKVIHDHQGIKMAEHVTWNTSKAKEPQIEDMSTTQLQAMILRLQAQLNEKKQVKDMIKNDFDDLPFDL